MSEAAKAYQALESMVVVGQLPPGSLHTERELSEQLGIGRTPLREALQKLAHEGMVQIQSRRGILIPPISSSDQFKLLKVRRVVEAVCVSEACANAGDADRKRMAKIAAELGEAAKNLANRNAFLAVLRDAHQALTDAADNPFLVLAMRPVQGLSRRFWFFHAHVEDYAKAAALHAAILESVSGGAEAQALTASHELIDYLEAFTSAAEARQPALV